MYWHEIWIEAKFCGGRSYTVLAILHLLDKEAVLVEEAVGSHTTIQQSEKRQEAFLLTESYSVVSDSLRPHGLYNPWYSPGQNTGVGSLFLLQEIFLTQGSKRGLPHCRQILYQLSYR